MSRYHWNEDAINQAAYPATIKPAIKRVLAIKLQELRDKHTDERTALETQLRVMSEVYARDDKGDYCTVPVDFDALSPQAQNLIVHIDELQEMIRANEHLLEDMGFRRQYNTVYRRATDTEVNEIKVRKQNMRNEQKANHDAELRELWQLVKELADAQVKKVTDAIPAHLRARIDDIGRALPAAQVAPALRA